MPLMHIPLENIEQSHLQALIDAQTAEARDIDYKRDTYGTNDAARAEFLADISSFANTLGGDLVIGMSETSGIPTSFVPFVGDADSERLRLEQMARAGLEPRIQNLQTKAVPISGGGAVLVVRVPRSYSKPHRVSFQGKNKFWARSSAGKYEPSVDELRSIFTLAPHLVERMRQFRTERITRIVGGDTPATLINPCCLALHIFPFSSFDVGSPVPLEQISADPQKFPPLASPHAPTWRINFDGLLTLSNGDQQAIQRAYTQVFRIGVVEAVASSLQGSAGHLYIQKIDAMVAKGTFKYIVGLHESGVEPPYAVMLSLFGVKGIPLKTGLNSIFESEPPPLDRDQYHFVEVIFETVPSNIHQCAVVLRPILTQLWNAAGQVSAVSLDGQGNYRLTGV